MEKSTKNNEKTLSAHYNAELDCLNNVSVGSDELFDGDNSLKFISSIFSAESANIKIAKCIKLITPFRAKHTVSAYLLGTIIRDKLQFDTRNWRRLPKESSPSGSFKLFWSWICLFHDIGYYYEEHSDKYLVFSQLEDLEKELGIENDLLSFSAYPDLIRKYYKKRVNDMRPAIDHGIVGAILLFDALMDLANGDKPYSEIRKYSSFFAKICDTIALHNMWRATEKTLLEYQQNNLYELIPSEDNRHMVFYRKNPLLFLLGIVDTIEPIKFFCRDKRYKHPVTHRDVLSDIKMAFIVNSGKKEIRISSTNEHFQEYVDSLQNHEEGLPAWLGVTCFTDKEKRAIVLSIDIESGKAEISSKKIIEAIVA